MMRSNQLSYYAIVGLLYFIEFFPKEFNRLKQVYEFHDNSCERYILL